VNKLELLIQHGYNMPDGWEVYVEHPDGGYVTIFRGSEEQCEEFVLTHGQELTQEQLFGRL
jgi:hypothetical protein